MDNVELKLDIWKKKLLDIGKKNRLINFKETKRSSFKITSPDIANLYQELVVNEKSLVFPILTYKEVDGEIIEKVIPGDLEGNITINEQQKTLLSLRNKSRTAKEEQGINVLYLAFGFLKWYETDSFKQEIISPLLLVPIKITIDSLASPYKMHLDEEDILINPALIYKLENDFGITLPQFNSEIDNLPSYLSVLEARFKDTKWSVLRESSIGLFSFLKINMYKDIEKNLDRMKSHSIVRSIAGDESCRLDVPSGLDNYDHDKNSKVLETFQVVDADSSQQDAILYSKHGCSFVLQGPPGTGKSQTITNIIAESIAEGKKVLFVSEKMAALEVVYNRLSSVDLGDFCLTLHSHKAKKKEVIEQLYSMLSYNKVKLQEEAIYKLNKLETIKMELNNYTLELHTKREPIQMSVYEINGKLSKLKNTDTLIFDFENIESISREQLNKIEYYLEEFSKTLGVMNDDFLLNPWRNCNVSTVTNELRHDIESNFTSVIPKLKFLNEITEKHCDELGIKINPTLESIDLLIEFLTICKDSPTVPLEWLNISDGNSLLTEIDELSNLKKDFLILQEDLNIRHKSKYFSLCPTSNKKSFIEAINKSKNITKSMFREENEILLNLSEYINLSTATNDFITKFSKLSNKLFSIFKYKEVTSVSEMNNQNELLKLLLKKPLPSEWWFSDEKFSIVNKELENVSSVYREIDELILKLKVNYNEKILEIDYNSIINRFKTDYTSFLKTFNKKYKEDKKLIISYRNDFNNKISDDEIIMVLTLVKTINEKKEWLTTNKKDLSMILGKRYLEKYTEWNKLENAIKDFSNIKNWFKGYSIPFEIRKILLEGKSIDLLIDLNKDITSLLSSNPINKYSSIFNTGDLNNLNNVKATIENNIEIINNLKINYDTLTQYNKNRLPYTTILNDLDQLLKMKKIEEVFQERSHDLSKRYQSLYNGLNTDFEDIRYKIEWLSKYKNYANILEIDSNFTRLVCSDVNFIYLNRTALEEISEINKNIKPKIKWIIKLFDVDEQLIQLNLLTLIDRLYSACNTLGDLEYWIDYRRAREKCQSNGLADFITKVQELKISSSEIINVFRKRFYRLLLDSILIDNEIINGFRGRVHESKIKEFKKLDKDQFIVAKLRIKERLINKLPDTNSFTSALDEVGVLKREANKQRKIMPLRRLFKEIPNLIFTLKPCLMMSPLSVSLFLESEHYNFDLVIFDEASQVCTENAIGAIFRGKQVIITGDSKQLPPTNFFNANSESDFDDNDEEYDYTLEGYESVLDEALIALPERTLKWHYRSRHEDLISFSNIKIYNSQLTTFPSNTDNIANNGVEYVYVENGIYERGTSKSNKIEAKKVVDLIYEHYDLFPNRSLGVVTFSEAQQDAINSELTKRRLKNTRYENFFSEDMESPFFIKNIENVQGDERDTIIFSIGYGKDLNGTMYMNFGPISREGGYRRLNVAITRAKYNIKLVGSIQPTDIDLNRTSSEGVKMLKSYIEFAINGPKAILNEIKESSDIIFDSPFEEFVYEFLISKGYSVATQVGCSGYKIDLAIRHPKINGIYVLAIECDGATYHSSRTARERDRLRQTVLEDIGWRVYRIWSTDWIKDSRTEGEKLLCEIENAIASYGIEDIQSVKWRNLKEKSDVESNEDYLIAVDNFDIFTTSEDNYGFSSYIEADITLIKPSDNTQKYLSHLLEYIVKTEQPIHFELLCKRIVSLFGNKKVTVKVRNTALHVINNYCNKTIRLTDEFCWLKSNEVIQVRVPNKSNDYIRPINFISKEEIGQAMIVIIEKSFGISKENLISLIPSVFGFNRLGANISKSIEDSYNYLIQENKITEIDGKLNIN